MRVVGERGGIKWVYFIPDLASQMSSAPHIGVGEGGLLGLRYVLGGNGAGWR